MCVGGTPGSDHHHSHVAQELGDAGASRRGFLKAGAAGALGIGLASVAPAIPAFAAQNRNGRGVVDLTHRLVREFPTFGGQLQVIFDEVLSTVEDDGFYTKRWTFDEHIGTHIDSPGHFTLGGTLVDALDPETLIAPIAVVDITSKAMDDPNATVEPEDLVAYERGNGRIPRGALVCMNSGWASKVDNADGFRGGTGFPDLNFPGFSGDATDWLNAKRDIVGIGVDTMSLDPGNSADFAVHVSFLGSGRYGIENLANLDRIPAKGALGFVGPIPWEDGSGGPCRVLATVNGNR